MKTKSNKKWSLIIAFILMIILFAFISFKLFSIQYSDTSIAYTHNPKFEKIKARRGNILSEDGRILSVYMPVYDVRLDVNIVENKLFEDSVENLSKRLHQLFKEREGRSASKYEKFLRDNKDARYLLLEKDVSYVQLQKMKKFPIFNQGKNKGGFIPVTKSSRAYPFGSLAKVTIGRVSIDNDSIIPQNGIELAFDKYLQGISGKQLTQEISGKVLVPKKSDYNVLPQSGKDVVTTINIEFQDAAEVALNNKLKETYAEWGCAILMEVETGDIKAIANLHRGKDSLYYDSKNHAILSSIAPGSTFKLASFLSLLEDGYKKVSDTIDTGNGKIEFYGSPKSDTKRFGYGKITFGDAFVVSSNVAISKEIFNHYNSKEGKKRFYENLQKFQLTEPLELQLPYTSTMVVKSPEEWSGVTLPSMSIGYEMQISPLHILTFYNAIANNGKMVSPRFVTDIKNETGIFKSFPITVISDNICSEETIKSIKPYMEQVISCKNCRTYKRKIPQRSKKDGRIYQVPDKYQIKGTANNIFNEDLSIAGKTGTCKVRFKDWDKQTKFEKSYSSSFVGFFPVDQPKYSCIVVIYDFKDPTNKNHYGGQIAAPVFEIISDKVYAFDSDLQDSISNKSNVSFEETLQKLEHSIISDQSKITAIKLDLEKGIMPDLSGMKLRDILPVFENRNLKIEFQGAGKVISQSVPYKSRIDNNELIEISLSW